MMSCTRSRLEDQSHSHLSDLTKIGHNAWSSESNNFSWSRIVLVMEGSWGLILIDMEVVSVRFVMFLQICRTSSRTFIPFIILLWSYFSLVAYEMTKMVVNSEHQCLEWRWVNTAMHHFWQIGDRSPFFTMVRIPIIHPLPLLQKLSRFSLVSVWDNRFHCYAWLETPTQFCRPKYFNIASLFTANYQWIVV